MKTQYRLPKLAIATFLLMAVTSALGKSQSLAAAEVSPPIDLLHFDDEASLKLDRNSNLRQLKSGVLSMKKCTIQRYRRPH